jgi:hypothetical protein
VVAIFQFRWNRFIEDWNGYGKKSETIVYTRTNGTPREYAKYLNERVLPERPEPAMTMDDLVTACMPRRRKRRHSESSGNFKKGGRIICDDAAEEIKYEAYSRFRSLAMRQCDQ